MVLQTVMRQGLLGGQGLLLIISVVPVSSRVRPDLGGQAAIFFSHETSEGGLAKKKKELQELLSPASAPQAHRDWGARY